MDISQTKKVSVIVPNYNYARFLKKRFRSILKQTYPIYELVILDDASVDGSDEIIETEIAKIKRKYPNGKLQYVRNEKNSGKVIAQWEKGFELSTGDFVWIAEVDDSSKKDFLAETMKGFDDPEVVISYTESEIINGKGIVIAPSFRWSRDREKTGHYNESYIKEGFREIEEIMAIRCTIPNVSAVVFRKAERIPYLKYLDEAKVFSQVGDWFFYAKVLGHGKISYNKKSLNIFRIHKGSKTSISNDNGIHYKELVGMHKMFAIKNNLTGEVVDRMQREEKRIRRKHGIIE